MKIQTQNSFESRIADRVFNGGVQLKEVILKNHILNRINEALNYSGIKISPNLRTVSIRFFGQAFDGDLKDANQKLLILRYRTMAKNEDFLPASLHYSMQCQRVYKGENHRIGLIQTYEKYFLNGVLSLAQTSKEYADLFIDARFDPLHKDEHWPPANAQPWHLPLQYLENLSKLYEKEGYLEKRDQILKKILELENYPINDEPRKTKSPEGF